MPGKLQGPGLDPVNHHTTTVTKPHVHTGEPIAQEPQNHLTEEEAREHAQRLSRRPGHSVAVHNKDGHVDTYIGGETKKQRDQRQLG